MVDATNSLTHILRADSDLLPVGGRDLGGRAFRADRNGDSYVPQYV